MKYPDIKKGVQKELFISGFDGYRPSDMPPIRSLSKLSALENVWCRENTVTVRPGISAETEPQPAADGVTTEMFFDRSYKNTGVVKKLCGKAWHGNENSIGAVLFCDGEALQKELKVNLSMPTGSTNFKVTKFLALTSPSLTNGSGVFIIFTVSFFMGNVEISKKFYMYEISSDLNSLNVVNNGMFYKPYIRINVKSPKYYDALFDGFEFPFGEEMKPEKENVFGGGFRVAYISDGITSTFPLPYKNLSANEGETISVEIRPEFYDGIRWDIPYNSNVSETVEYLGRQIRAHVDRAAGTVTFRTPNGDDTVLSPSSAPNMLVITAHKFNENKLIKFINSVSDHAECSERLFLSGGNNVYYSGKNENFYFSEYKKITVGDAQTNVTALAFQNKYLVVFKTAGVYRISVTGNPDNDYETLLNSIKKTSLPEMKYTLTMINSSIGCTCPDTVALCSNRLVWLNGDKNVYTLMGTNLYTEGSVYEISANIKTHLKRINITENTFAGEYDGYYFLFSENEVFVLDGNIGGLRYMSGEKRNANNGMEWYYWRFDPDIHVREMFMTEDKCVLALADAGGIYRAALNGSEDVFYSSFERKTKPVSWYFESGEIMLSKGAPVTVFETRFDMLNEERVSLCVFDDKGTKAERTVEYRDGNSFSRVLCDTPFYFADSIRFRMSGTGKIMLRAASVRYKTR